MTLCGYTLPKSNSFSNNQSQKVERKMETWTLYSQGFWARLGQVQHRMLNPWGKLGPTSYVISLRANKAVKSGTARGGFRLPQRDSGEEVPASPPPPKKTTSRQRNPNPSEFRSTVTLLKARHCYSSGTALGQTGNHTTVVVAGAWGRGKGKGKGRRRGGFPAKSNTR